MAIQLVSPVRPAFLKLGLYGDTGSGKTWTAAKMLSQFIKEFCPDRRLAMFDTEPGSGYIANMVKQITGKEILVTYSRFIADLFEFAEVCAKEGHVALLDSATHPWETLKADALEAKRSRLAAAGGNPETARMFLPDWQPVFLIWDKFVKQHCFDPVHWCICGREALTTETVVDESGNERLTVTGDRMKTQKETGYESNLLLRMHLVNRTDHVAEVVKDRFDAIPAGTKSKPEPDVEFIRPHLERLDLGGKHPSLPAERAIFEKGEGANYETTRARRAAVLESIKDDLLLALPGQDVESKKAKVLMIRAAFDKDANWASLETNDKKYTQEVLQAGRKKLTGLLKKLSKETTPKKE